MTNNVHISTHPLIKHKLTILRDKQTDHVKFRQLIRELALLLCYEATQDMHLKEIQVETPMGTAPGAQLTEEIGLVPILRAGLGMVEGIWELMPSAEVWHIGLYRDEKTLRPVEYYNKLPIEPRVQVCFVLDPMLATGGSSVATVDILKRWGVKRNGASRHQRTSRRTRRPSQRYWVYRAGIRRRGRQTVRNPVTPTSRPIREVRRGRVHFGPPEQ